MKITIIQLLNKIANGEEVPKKIKFNEDIYTYHDKEHGYCKHYLDNTYICINSEYYLFDILNDEVEIITEDKEIEKIDIMSDEATPNSYYILNEHGTKCYLTKHSKVIADRVNLLIDKVNSLENKQ